MADPGLRVWDEYGNETLTLDSRLMKFLGSIPVGGAGSAQSGSITDSRFSLGEPFWFVHIDWGSYTPGGFDVEVKVTGNVLTWRYPSTDGSVVWKRPPSIITYGIF